MANQASEPRLRSKYPRREREDGRVQFLVFLPPALVKRIKGVAHDRDEYAYHIVERVLKNALDRMEGQNWSETDWPRRVVDSDGQEPFIEGHRPKWIPGE